jgi:hypothetical protein
MQISNAFRRVRSANSYALSLIVLITVLTLYTFAVLSIDRTASAVKTLATTPETTTPPSIHAPSDI